MDFTTSSQLMVFVYAILGGMACAFVFDLFRIARRVQGKISAVQVFIQDIIFFVLLSVILFITYLYANDSDVRGYEFLGTLLGAVIYFVVISRMVTRLLLFVIRIFGKALEKVLRVVLFPLVFLLRLFKRPAQFVVIRLGGLFGRIGRFFSHGFRMIKDSIKKVFVISKKV